MKICTFCGTKNRDDESFCTHCGASLDSSPVTGNVDTSLPASTANTTQFLIPGAQLQEGRYVIQKILGQGGMGTLALAIDTRLVDKPVVIKELIAEHADPTEDVRNFQREVQTLAHLDHPLIPAVTDHFQEGSHYFMVQEYVEGENLDERMERIRRPMDEQEALKYAAEVLDILDYLEQQKPPIVHRDIKPANIIIGARDQKAHLVDFGIARLYAPSKAQRKQTTALGTPGYAPPEQYQGNAEPRSDLYALAATLYYLLTNRDPTEHPLFQFPPARTINPRLSPEVETLLERALTLDINQRYQTALEMKRDIDAILYPAPESPGLQSTGIGITYSPRLSGPLGRIPISGALGGYSSGQVQQFYQPPASQPVTRRSPFAPYQAPNAPGRQQPSPSPGKQPLTSNVAFVFFLFVLFIFLLGIVGYFLLGYAHGLGGAASGLPF
ncbi:MAG TPA: protein kinase [Ktedonobacteraceae bacterium]|jgi:serine/threonine protein kinase|nr:protein kinase [Ktedonobacteraceae bacterium]